MFKLIFPTFHLFFAIIIPTFSLLCGDYFKHVMMNNYYFRDYGDLSMEIELDVVCCVCETDVGLFDEVLICQCCLNKAHQTCTSKYLNLPEFCLIGPDKDILFA